MCVCVFVTIVYSVYFMTHFAIDKHLSSFLHSARISLFLSLSLLLSGAVHAETLAEAAQHKIAYVNSHANM